MTVVAWAVRLLPLPVLAWYLYSQDSLWPSVVLGVVLVLLPRSWIVVAAGAGALVFLDASWTFVAWCVGYPILLASTDALRDVAAGYIRYRPLPLGPRIWRCPHVRRTRLRRADRMLRWGRPADALNEYLDVLAVHPPEALCTRIVLTRAAEAAVECGALDLAPRLCAAAVRGLSETPLLQEASLASRAHAVRALVEARSGRAREAIAALTRAQDITHRDRHTHQFVKLAAVRTSLLIERPRTVDGAGGVWSVVATAQRLLRPQSATAGLSLVELAEVLLEAGLPFDALKILDHADELLYLSDEPPWGDSSSIPGRRSGNDVVYRAWAVGLAVRAEAMLRLRRGFADDMRTRMELAALVALKLGDPQTAAQIAVCLTEGTDEKPADLADYRPHVFADAHLRVRWTRLRRRAFGEGGAWPPGSTIEAAAQRAAELFNRLGDLLPGVSIGAAAAWQAEPPTVAPEAVADRPHDDAPAATTATRPAAFPDTASGVSDAAPTAKPSKAPAAKNEGRVVVEPAWLTEIDALSGENCWTLRYALQEARELGHEHLGGEHLLLGCCWDQECAVLLTALGASPPLLRQALAALAGPIAAAPERPARDLISLLETAVDYAREDERIRAEPRDVLAALAWRRDGIAAHVLSNLGVDLEELLFRSTVYGIAERPPPSRPPMGTASAALTLPAQRAVARAARAAEGRVGVVHLLLAACGDRHSRLSAVLAQHGLTDAETGPLARLAVNAPSSPRWTGAAKDALAQADAEADAMAHRGIDVEHLVLGALDHWGVGEELVTLAADGTSLAARLRGPAATFSDDARRLLDAATSVAAGLGHRTVGPEHLLFDQGNVAAHLGWEAHLTDREPVEPPPFTPRLKRLLERARDTAVSRSGEVHAADIRAAVAREPFAAVFLRQGTFPIPLPAREQT